MEQDLDLARDPHPLRGRAALVTGASRRQGIGFAIARRLAAWGGSVFLHHHRPHDGEQPRGADDADEVRAGVSRHLVGDARVADAPGDLVEPGEPERLVQHVVAEFGNLDVLVCNHARSGSDGALGELDAEVLDGHWAVNTRSSILLAQAFAAHHDGRPGGRVVFLTSGQQLGPMPGEVAYAAAKGALAEITLTLSDQLADSGITVNTVNPGPVQTGYLGERDWHVVAPMFPFGRYGEPDDPARLIAWLSTDEARWITGQVINTEGGFARWRTRWEIPRTDR
ncbi:SDR family oxidoreductase [Saccharopolyspora sp.]|uniref:SDR family oxidoreductase n=1 Tax=Saccharopolyspora sp. TaxID=33915 RepID=UPI0025D371F1|nr:SDR family oxidoreductase [Saccharopolyspora sp.]